ncbi:MAG: LytR C-terminal domain-containing protein [Rhodothermaceae bacterium]
MATVKNQKTADIKTTTTNFVLNIVIFLLVALIIYLVFSVAMKFGDDSSQTPKNNTEVVSEIIQVDVLNGCGKKGAADRFTDFLRNNKIDVVKTDNYISFDIDKTMVIDRIGNMANAKKIADLLGVSRKNVIQQLNEDYFLDVTVIIGKDYYNLAPLK